MRILLTCFCALLLHAGIALAQPEAQPVHAEPAAPSTPGQSPDLPKDLVRIRTPLLSQVLMFASPQGFRTAYQDTEDRKFTQEFILEGESVDKWSQMIMVIGYPGFASNPLASPTQHATAVGNLFRRNCPVAYSGASLGESRIDGFDAYTAIMSCGLVKPKDPYSETTLFIVIKGEKDFYTLQWTEHGKPSMAPIKFDKSIWQARLDSLQPIKLCSDQPGEYPLYADCFRKKTDR